MKKLFLVLAFLLSTISYSQGEVFNYDVGGLSPKFLVKEIDGVDKQDLFERVVNWVKETYKNPQEVIEAKIGNRKVRINGIASDALSTKVLGSVSYHDLKYTIEISVKDGKYKFEPISLKYYRGSSLTSSGGWYNLKGSDMYRKNGNIKHNPKRWPSQIKFNLNSLEYSLNNYIKEYESLDDNW